MTPPLPPTPTHTHSGQNMSPGAPGSPKYLFNKFGTAYPCQTRLAASKKIRITANFDAELSLAHQSFRWRASRLYNELPISIRSESKVVGFKFQLKQWVKANIDI